MALSNEIGGQGTHGRLHLAGKGRHWPPQKNPAAPGHESLDGRIRSREGGSDPSVVGEFIGARYLFPQKTKTTHVSLWPWEFFPGQP